MSFLTHLKALSGAQRATFVACLLGWTLDAFDFFLLIFVVKAIAAEFHTRIISVTFAITLTLLFRPLGALVFGRLADRFGRKPILMINIALFSLFELLSAFSPNLTVLLVTRSLFGFAMGGEWGIGSSLVMESIPVESRGLISGILQEGYALGYLLAALVYGLFFNLIGWRGMFILGLLPALLVFYIRMKVKESPVWKKVSRQSSIPELIQSCRKHYKIFLYAVVLMTGFNFLSHGTQDLYPTFLQVQHHFSSSVVSLVTIIGNVGAILGGVVFGTLSERIGRRRAIMGAALLVLPIIPLWAFSTTPLLLGLGAFLLQIAVQGAWGVVPVHLNELSPAEVRGTFPGFAYQLGNMFACGNATLQAWLAGFYGGRYSIALALMAGTMAVVIVILAGCGREAKGIAFTPKE